MSDLKPGDRVLIECVVKECISEWGVETTSDSHVMVCLKVINASLHGEQSIWLRKEDIRWRREGGDE